MKIELKNAEIEELEKRVEEARRAYREALYELKNELDKDKSEYMLVKKSSLENDEE